MRTHSPQRRARAVLAATAALTLVLAGCGLEEPLEESAPRAGTVDVEAVLDAKAAAAVPLEDGDGPASYEPTGTIVADSGFRPDADGFAFANYGDEVEGQDLEPRNVERLFGAQVCVSGTGADCVLTPAAQTWMDSENASMANGHCMGMSVASLRMYAETLASEDFGADVTNELELEDNEELRATLAESFVYQSLDRVLEQQFTGTPTEVVEELAERLEAGEDTWTLGFYKRDGSDGHAMTPLAVEDKGDGQKAILVYDNNHPDTVQVMDVDTKADTYRYVGAPSPDVEPDVYEGDATSQPLELIPTSPGEALQPCPFCDDALLDEGGGDKGRRGTPLGAAEQYAELSLTGDSANHPSLLLTTEDGRQTGVVDGVLKREIPGVRVVRQYVDDPSLGTPEPRFRIPVGLSVNVTIDGSALTRPSEDLSVDYVADGKVVSAEDFTMQPGQVDELFIAGGQDITLVYETDAQDGVAPTFFAGVDERDASYTLGGTAVGLERGSLLGMAVLQDSGQVLFDTSDAKGVDGEATVVLAVGKLDTSGEEQVWLADDVVVDTGAREDVYLDYGGQALEPGSPVELEVGPEDGPFRTVEAAYDE